MSDLVEVPFGDNAKETAVLLLAAAEELDLDRSVVATKTGAFVVPKKVAKKAKVKGDEVEEAEVVDTNAKATEEAPAPEAEAKEAPAKKTAAKKTAAAKKK